MDVTKKCETEEIIIAKIYLKLEEIDRPLRWLARRSEINYNTFYGIMRQRTTRLSQKYLDKINEVLSTDYCIEL